MKEKIKYGFCGGRFQPFHLGHLECLLTASKLCEILILGIIPAPKIKQEGHFQGPFHPAINPFTFWERLLMIRESLKEERLNTENFIIVPFYPPMVNEEVWGFYHPKDITYLMIYTTDWEKKKVDMFKKYGRVKIIKHSKMHHPYSASEVRRRMINDENWEELVPKAVIRIIKEIDGVNRLKKLAKKYPEFYR